MQYSSNQTSPLNMARTLYAQDRAMLGRANAGQSTLTVSQAMALLNKSRAKLRQVASGKPPAKHLGFDFTSTVAGIPCGVCVTYFDGGTPAQLFGPPENCYPEEGPDVEYSITDRSGYAAPWLEAKLTDHDDKRITQEAISYAL